MTENYIQYATGYQKDNIGLLDIKKAINDIQITDDENIIEINKDLNLSIIIGDKESKFQALDWSEVERLYTMLLNGQFEELKKKISEL